MSTNTNSDSPGVYFGGEQYNIGDLTIGDVAEIEDELGQGIMELLEQGSMKVVIWIVYMVKRKSDPSITWEAVANTPMSTLFETSGDSDPLVGSPESEAVEPSEAGS